MTLWRIAAPGTETEEVPLSLRDAAEIGGTLEPIGVGVLVMLANGLVIPPPADCSRRRGRKSKV